MIPPEYITELYREIKKKKLSKQQISLAQAQAFAYAGLESNPQRANKGSENVSLLSQRRRCGVESCHQQSRRTHRMPCRSRLRIMWRAIKISKDSTCKGFK